MNRLLESFNLYYAYWNGGNYCVIGLAKTQEAIWFQDFVWRLKNV